jgi:prepilin-type N-terminal cleavage/methylation domain-containing protein
MITFRKGERGYTVMELLVVLAVLAILAGLSMAGFSKFSKKEALDAGAAALIAGLRDARAQTLASVGGSQYGIQVATTSFIFFKGSTYNPVATTTSVFKFSSYVRASSTQSAFVFQRITGNAVASGTIDVYMASNPDIKKTIRVEATGIIDIE